MAAIPDAGGEPAETASAGAGAEPQTPEPAAVRPEDLTPENFARLQRENVKHRRDARAAQATADEERRQREELRLQHESEQERAIREAVEAERVKLTGEFADERLQNRLRLRAAGKLRDPEDAVLHLAGQLQADADDAALDAALEQLIKDRDYLAAPANGGAGGALVTQGARSTAPRAGEGSPDDWIRSQARRR